MAVSVTAGIAAVIQNPAFAGGNSTFTGMNGGTSYPANTTILFFICNKNVGTITGVTVGGNNMTLAINATPSSNGIELYYYDNTSASTVTDTVVVLGGASGQFIGGMGFYLTGAATGGPSATQSNVALGNIPVTVSIVVPTNGAAVGGFVFQGTNFTPTWTGVTASGGDLNSAANTNIFYSGAHSLTAGTDTIGLQSGGGGFGTFLAVAAWGAAATTAAIGTTIILMGVG